MPSIKLCCARVAVHLMPTTPSAELDDADGVEMALVLGSSVEGGHLGDVVALVEDDNVVAAAPISDATDIKDALQALVGGMVKLFERRATGQVQVNARGKGVVH